MGIISGSDGKTFTEFGNGVFGSDGSTYYRHPGGISGPMGTTYELGGTTMLSGGRGVVNRIGNMWHGPNGAYTLTGNMLTGPGGKVWHGVNERDVNLIIDSDSGRTR